MNLLLAVAFVFCIAGTIGKFPPTAVIFLAVFSAIPATVSMELGTNTPLLSASRVLLVPLLAALGCQLALRRTNVLTLPLAAPLALLVCAHATSLVVSGSSSLTGWLQVFSLAVEEVGVYCLAHAVVTNEPRARHVLLGLSAILLVILGYTVMTIAIGYNPVAEQALALREGLVFDYSLVERFGLPRHQSFFRNPLDLGVYLMLAIPAAVCVAREARSTAEAVLGWCAVAAGTISAILSGSRTVIYTLVVALAAYIILRRRWRLAITLSAAAIVGVAIVVTYLGFPLFDYLITSALLPSLFLADVGGSSWDSLWRVTGEHLRMALERPLFGWGVGTLPPNRAGEGLDPYLVGYGEQGYSYMLVETGLLGLGAIGWLFVKVTRRLWHGANHGTSGLSRRMCMAYLCAMVGYGVGMQLEGMWHFGMLLVCVAIAGNSIDWAHRRGK